MSCGQRLNKKMREKQKIINKKGRRRERKKERIESRELGLDERALSLVGLASLLFNAIARKKENKKC